MRVAILSSWSHLKEYAGQSNYHLTLAHLYKIPEYAEFYHERFTQGDWVILDNGANEGVDITDQELAHMALQVGVNEVVAPDQPRDGEESTERTLKFIATYGNMLRDRGKHIMGVPQGKSVRQWLHNFQLIAPLVDTIGVSKKIEELNGDRVCLVRMIESSSLHKPIHLLGADRILWWIAKYTMPRIRGVDTQKPFAAGLSGIELDNSTDKEEFKSVDLAKVAIVPSDHGEQHLRINRNILRYRKWAGDTTV
ncbi:hypothetical protein LCGC14_0938910 [marine sediment metagenome]|uniref:Uncharacterized protein n=1 Tax=marine sediment metagenome TaxID=412755 RepID=A0A0F9RS06_9ZZZZ